MARVEELSLTLEKVYRDHENLMQYQLGIEKALREDNIKLQSQIDDAVVHRAGVEVAYSAVINERDDARAELLRVRSEKVALEALKAISDGARLSSVGGRPGRRSAAGGRPSSSDFVPNPELSKEKKKEQAKERDQRMEEKKKREQQEEEQEEEDGNKNKKKPLHPPHLKM